MNLNYAAGYISQGAQQEAPLPPFVKEEKGTKERFVRGNVLLSKADGSPGNGADILRRRTGGAKTKSPAGTHWIPQLALRPPGLVSSTKYHGELDLLDAAIRAYNLHPKRENLDLGDNPNDASVLLLLSQKLQQFAEGAGFERVDFIEENGKVEVALVEELGDANENLTVDLCRLVRLEKRDKKAFHTIMSVLKHVFVKAGVPDWSVMVGNAESTVESYEDDPDFARDSFQPDDSQDESSYVDILNQSIKFYQKGLPEKWRRRIVKYKAVGLADLSKFKSSSRLLNEIVGGGVSVASHPLAFHEYCNIFNYDEGLNIYEFINFSWDYTTEVERLFIDYIENAGNNSGVIPPRRIVRINRINDWVNAEPYGYTFFNPLTSFITSLNQYLRK